ncbi:MAG TPA: hypothetical protein VMU14_14240 [Acidimicrobiales bacterium]|nr:hypothetical protein [Acidimicrobiales bacterium]
MFERNPLSRRLRDLQRSIEVPLGLDDDVDLDDVLAALCGWAASLPFALELPRPDLDPLRRRFVVDCPPLGCREPWFAIGAFSTDHDVDPAVVVVLPPRLADRGASVGWAVRIGELDSGRAIVGVALPTSAGELRGLQGLLEVAYTKAFT